MPGELPEINRSTSDRPTANQPATAAAARTHAGLSRRHLFAGAGAIGAGAALLNSPPVGATTRPAAAAAAAGTDPVSLLRTMIGFDTQNFGQGGKTRPHAEWLQSVWQAAGVSAEIIPTPQPDNVHLIARIKGTTAAPPLLLLGHSDVVPVETENWSQDPFAGTVVNGEIYGRGALDMKGTNAASIAALLKHLGEGAKFERDIIVLTDCDEEAGQYGSGWLAEQHWDKLDAGMVLTEGGWLLAQRDGRTPMLITVTCQDKVYFNVDLVARGTATHSSKPMPDAAIAAVSRAVAALDGFAGPVRLTDLTREYFGNLAAATHDRAFAAQLRKLLDAKSDPQREKAALAVVNRSDYPYLHSALLRTTFALVISEAGYKENVIPSSATIRLNCRGVPGGQKPREFLAALRQRLARTGVEVKLDLYGTDSEAAMLDQLDKTWARPAASLDTPLYEAIEQAAGEAYKGAVFSPALFEAGTSLGPWREKNIPGYGVYPYVITNDQLIAMHGNDERIFTAALEKGTDFMYRVFDRFRA